MPARPHLLLSPSSSPCRWTILFLFFLSANSSCNTPPFAPLTSPSQHLTDPSTSYTAPPSSLFLPSVSLLVLATSPQLLISPHFAANIPPSPLPVSLRNSPTPRHHRPSPSAHREATTTPSSISTSTSSFSLCNSPEVRNTTPAFISQPLASPSSTFTLLFSHPLHTFGIEPPGTVAISPSLLCRRKTAPPVIYHHQGVSLPTGSPFPGLTLAGGAQERRREGRQKPAEPFPSCLQSGPGNLGLAHVEILQPSIGLRLLTLRTYSVGSRVKDKP